MNTNITPEQIKQSFTYNADLSDVNHLASEYFEWVSTLIHQAKKELIQDNKAQAETLLHIAEYLADNYADDFHKEAVKLENKGL